ncbi:MAG TPA: glycosyltransferase family 1 protein [Acidobacteriaceae bacterium]|jgi:glycosyltransferase involved in cell wall biosynthesis|nr:glycosyltransferase family 1 protein [Acidobacteriaceae bacterium]
MKILVAAPSFAANLSGVQRHAINLARCLLSQPEITTLFFVVAPWQDALIQAATLIPDPRLIVHVAALEQTSARRNAWYYRQLPRLAADLQADLVHLTCPMPVRQTSFRCPIVVTLHDLYPFEIPLNFGFPRFIFNRIVLGQCLRNTDAIACVSNATQARLRHYLPALCRRAVCICNCVEPASPATPPIPLHAWDGEPFLLSVAQHRRNKNLPLLIRTWHRLLQSQQLPPATNLVIVGIEGPETPALRRLVAERGLEHRVRLVEGLPEAQLLWCYQHCEALLAPSITEGFGLPVAEGLLAGCRIVCSDIPAHREIGGTRCTFVPLGKHAEQDLARAIHDRLQAPKPQPALLPHFSAQVLGRQYAALYRRLIAASVRATSIASSMATPPAERACIVPEQEIPSRSAGGWR